MAGLNELIHQSARLRIMSALAVMGVEAQVEFTFLKKTLELSDGNLGAHLLKLEEAGYLVQEKTFVDRKPRTYIRMTQEGLRAFQAHVEALRALLG